MQNLAVVKKKLDICKNICYSMINFGQTSRFGHLPKPSIRLAGLASPARLQEKCSPSPRSGEWPGSYRDHRPAAIAASRGVQRQHTYSYAGSPKGLLRKQADGRYT